MNTRTFSCFRRRPHIVDLLTPVVPGVSTYTVLWAQNFDGIFAPIINCSNVGFYDDNIPRGKTELQNTQGFVRMTFDPTTFAVETDEPVNKSEDGVIGSKTDIFAGEEFCAALADDDVSSNHGLAAEFLHAESFADAIASVFYGALTFFMSHKECR